MSIEYGAQARLAYNVYHSRYADMRIYSTLAYKAGTEYYSFDANIKYCPIIHLH